MLEPSGAAAPATGGDIKSMTLAQQLVQNGTYTIKGTGPKFVDQAAPGALGGMIYRDMGFNGGAAGFEVPNATGAKTTPVDLAMATSPDPGNAPWLATKFGLA